MFQNLLHALNIKISQTDSPVNMTCPVHQGINETMLSYYDANGVCIFECLAPQCRFKGDLVLLYAAVKKISFLDALEQLKNKGPLYTLIQNDIDPEIIERYIANRITGIKAQDYINQSRPKLLSQISRYDFDALVKTNPNLLPPNIGLILSDTILPQLERFSSYSLRYKYLIYLYTHNHLSTHFLVQTNGTQNYEYIPLTDKIRATGIFPETGELTDQTILMATSQNPHVTAEIYATLKKGGMSVPPLIDLYDIVLHANYYNVQILILLSLPDTPLSLEKALKFLTATEHIENTQ